MRNAEEAAARATERMAKAVLEAYEFLKGPDGLARPCLVTPKPSRVQNQGAVKHGEEGEGTVMTSAQKPRPGTSAYRVTRDSDAVDADGAALPLHRRQRRGQGRCGRGWYWVLGWR